jgi:transposase
VETVRQAEGLLRSIADVLRIDIATPDHTTLSRRDGGLTILPRCVDRSDPLHLLVDSTGLKSYGEGEWLDPKHGIRSRRRWRKLHLGIDAVTHEIVASELTPDDVGDAPEIPALHDRIDAEVASLTADGAYDGEAIYDAVAEHHPEAAVIIPRERQRFRTKYRRRSAIDILQRFQNMAAWVGSVAPATIAGAWPRPQCIATRPLSAGGVAPGL